MWETKKKEKEKRKKSEKKHSIMRAKKINAQKMKKALDKIQERKKERSKNEKIAL